MKKIIVICGVIFLLSSCSKDESYCAYCTELTTGTQATPFCGSEILVNTYISNKESFDSQNPTLIWECYKEKQFDHTSH